MISMKIDIHGIAIPLKDIMFPPSAIEFGFKWVSRHITMWKENEKTPQTETARRARKEHKEGNEECNSDEKAAADREVEKESFVQFIELFTQPTPAIVDLTVRGPGKWARILSS